MLWWMANAAGAAPCAEVVAPGQVSARLDEAVLSYAVLDQETFERAADQAQQLATCVGQPLEPGLVAALHRVRAMRYLLLADPDRAATSLAASARLDPTYRLPAAVAPEGGPLAESWALALRSEPPPTTPVALQEGLRAWVDGHADAPRPTIGPYCLQVQGRSLATTWVVEGPPDPSLFPAPGAPVAGPAPAPVITAPTVPAAPVSSGPLADLETESSSGRRGHPPLLYAGVGTGVVAAGLWGTAAAARAGYDEAPTASRYSLINSTWLASVGTGVLSTSLIATWLATR
jgi:hypothetical protein